MLEKIKESPLFLSLNNKQQEAVMISPDENVLCLSGAGTGKTKTLVAKIAILIKGFNVKEKEILAVTFTNKAANEMKERIKNSFRSELSELLIGTFHSIAYKLIKQEIHMFPEYKSGFSIMDEQDKKMLVKRLFENNDKVKVSKEENIKRNQEFLKFINYYREAGFTYDDLASKKVKIATKKEKWLPYYKMYEKRLILEQQIDFSGLLILLRDALKNNKEFFEKYSGVYKCILVDEFQDTNNIQFEIVKLLTKKGGSIFAVGDDDQSIYGFRGANVENIRKFAREDAKHIIKLEQNYRSTKNILAVANNIIEDINVTNKKLWTNNKEGCLVRVSKYDNEINEASLIADDIKTKLNDGILPEDIAILYRVNSQSMVFEDQLIKREIDYRIVGGLKFFERKEIKDLISHAKILISLNDINSFSRAINNPSAFGIGAKRLSIWQKMAINNNIEFEKVIREVSACDNVAHKFIKNIDKTRKQFKILGVYETFKSYLNDIGFLELYKDDSNRMNRINELLELLRVYDEAGGKDFSEFINLLVITDSNNKTTNNDDCIHMSSIHAAKGLEFDYVYLIGLNENIFPHQKSIGNPKDLEEERRLMYVGITRAKKELNLSFYSKKLIKNDDTLVDVMLLTPSRYLSYINPKYIENRQTSWPPNPIPKDWGKYNGFKTGLEKINSILEKERNLILKPQTNVIIKNNNIDFKIGEYIKHDRFGIGKILNIINGIDPTTTRIQIEFIDNIKRTLFLNYIKIEKINYEDDKNATKRK